MISLPPATTRSTEPQPPRLSRPARVAEAIKDWIVQAHFSAGDRLPSEPELIARFGMAKSTIREAMRILEAQGLVKSRTGPGGGTFVLEVSKERARALLGNYFYFKDLTIRDIYKLRRVLEPELAASLAGDLSEEVLGQLEAIIGECDAPAETLEEERAQHIASLKFHALLAEQSDNALLGFLIDFMVNMLSGLTVYRKLYEPPNEELWRRGAAFHFDLIDALRAGDADTARLVMRDHMETAQKLMEALEVEMQRRFISE
ncbi:MAG TPA: GntR family transcriptional regulator [Rhodobacteraceae bacterium]|nr:GntR family transcriptional regulator [Paracoccaceae bacterium]